MRRIPTTMVLAIACMAVGGCKDAEGGGKPKGQGTRQTTNARSDSVEPAPPGTGPSSPASLNVPTLFLIAKDLNILVVMPGQAASGSVNSGMGSAMTLTPQDADAILATCPSVRAAAPVVRASARSSTATATGCR